MTETSSTVRVWDAPVRVFHWLLAGSFAGAYLLSESERWRNVHVAFGYTVIGLVVFRLVWGLVGTRHARFSDFAYGPLAAMRHLRDTVTGRARHYLGHNPAGSWAVYGLLLLALATGATGYMTFNEIGGERLEDVHEICANAWLALVIAHVAGVILSSRAEKDNLVRAMITGRKRASRTEPESKSLVGVGVAVAAVVAAFWGYTFSGGPLPGATSQGADGGQSALASDPDSDDD